jgi:hypothetical protein
MRHTKSADAMTLFAVKQTKDGRVRYFVAEWWPHMTIPQDGTLYWQPLDNPQP